MHMQHLGLIYKLFFRLDFGSSCCLNNVCGLLTFSCVSELKADVVWTHLEKCRKGRLLEVKALEKAPALSPSVSPSSRKPGVPSEEREKPRRSVDVTLEEKRLWPAAGTHPAPSSSSRPAPREGTASAAPSGRGAGLRPAGGAPRPTAPRRARRRSGGRPAASSPWPPGSRVPRQRWRRRPTGACGTSRRSAGSGGAERTAPPLCTRP